MLGFNRLVRLNSYKFNPKNPTLLCFPNPNPNPNIRMEDCDGVLHWINSFLEDDLGCDVTPPMSLSDLWDCRAIGVVASNVLVSFIRTECLADVLGRWFRL